jgi:hypothetical protein
MTSSFGTRESQEVNLRLNGAKRQSNKKLRSIAYYKKPDYKLIQEQSEQIRQMEQRQLEQKQQIEQEQLEQIRQMDQKQLEHKQQIEREQLEKKQRIEQEHLKQKQRIDQERLEQKQRIEQERLERKYQVRDELSYTPERIYCECIVEDFTSYKPTASLKIYQKKLPEYDPVQEVKKHVYDHVLRMHVPKNCCDIVADYVGNVQMLTMYIANGIKYNQTQYYKHKYVKTLGNLGLESHMYDTKISYIHTHLYGYYGSVAIFYDFDNLSFESVQSNELPVELFTIVMEYLKPENKDEYVIYDEISLSLRFRVYFDSEMSYIEETDRIKVLKKNIVKTHKKYWFLESNDNDSKLICKRELEYIMELAQRWEHDDYIFRRWEHDDYIFQTKNINILASRKKILGIKVIPRTFLHVPLEQEIHIKCYDTDDKHKYIHSYTLYNDTIGDRSKETHYEWYHGLHQLPDRFVTESYKKWYNDDSRIMREYHNRLYPVLT